MKKGGDESSTMGGGGQQRPFAKKVKEMININTSLVIHESDKVNGAFILIIVPM